MFKLIITLTLTFCSIGRINTRGPNQPLHSQPPQCLAQVLCTEIEDLTWTMDDQRCSVLLNPCIMHTANCVRLRRKEPLLRRVSKEVCQPQCPEFCTLQYDPICAVYRGRRRTFGNSCQLGTYICRSGEFYRFLFQGECEQRINDEVFEIA